MVTINKSGYAVQWSESRLRYEHRRVAERALGKPLPKSAVIHHVNGDRSNNSPSNLVICENAQYHVILHYRQHVLASGGNPNTDNLCCHCHKAKPRVDFCLNRRGPNGRHYACRNCCKIYKARLND